MINAKRVLAVGAHPDDIEFGCLGLLIKLGAATELNVFVGSLGSAGDPTSGPRRKDEGLASLRALNCASIHFREKVGIHPRTTRACSRS